MLKIGPQRLKNDAKTLADKVLANDIKFDVILIVTRGGLHLGYYLARHLGIRDIRTINISSYDGKTPVLLKEVTNHNLNFGGKSVLVVDDLIDSGRTLNYIEALFEKRGYLSYAVLYKKDQHGCKIPPEKIFFTTTMPQEEWIEFYYEC